ncbi:MAG TPA: hypothetical protein VGO90_15800 [Chthoniobacteraceae bacterium]|jgi:hypothetical protein|nr:hypothetical protein [Chthoniobacteraceae bacterium]
MNQPNDPASPNPTPPNWRTAGPPQSPPTVPELPIVTTPLAADAAGATVLETLLKRPVVLVAALQEARSSRFALLLGGFALLALAAYGIVVGTFSGGEQLYLAPLKISLGALASVLICLPSLFIFASLSGAEVTFRGVLGVLSAVLALTSLLLVGFAPVVWVFSQSSDSLGFIGLLHLLFWLIGLAFGLRLLGMMMDHLRVRDRFHIRVWSGIFVLVSLQMTTALRPIIGKANTVLPPEKKFFLGHWADTVYGEAGSRD